MRPFDLELAKQGNPVCTRDGRPARIICFDRKNPNNMFPIVALVECHGVEKHYHYTNEGKFGEGRFGICEYGEDLFMATKMHEGFGWINKSSKIIYNTKEEALSHRPDIDNLFLAKVEWEE